MADTIALAETSINEAIRKIVRIACKTLRQEGTHIPTAVLHTLEGVYPIVLPFKNDEQRRALVDFVKTQALEKHAFAVTTVTCAKVVDSRTKEEREVLVIATTVQGGKPRVAVQPFTRNADKAIDGFGALIEGEEAAMPGQMMIFPDWEEETRH